MAPTKAYDWTLRLKGAIFDTLCRYRQAQHLLPKDDAFQERVARYRSQKEFLANMALNPPTGKAAERIQKQIEEARQEVAELEKELNRTIAQKMPDVFAEREAVHGPNGAGPPAGRQRPDRIPPHADCVTSRRASGIMCVISPSS